MARQWRAGGDGKAVFFPELPWKRDKAKPAAQEALDTLLQEHETAIAAQRALDLDSSRTQYYFYCSCGMCGKPRTTRKAAVEEADLHVEACA